MPRVIEADTNEQIEVGDLIETLEGQPFLGSQDEDWFASLGPDLKKLANNRRFLAELVMQELKEHCNEQLRHNHYSPQVILLYSRSRRFALRAAFWPAKSDTVLKASGPESFYYGLPHDHNFSFLTVGYAGPGYWSDYYEYENDKVAGFTGEKVDLRFVERSRLDPGKVMLYRAHKDVHLQWPADQMSVSLNILETPRGQEFRDQYRFDIERGEIAGILTRSSIEPLLALSAHLGGEEGLDLLDRFAASHPHDRVRFEALRARAGRVADLDRRIALFEEATRTRNRFVSEMSKREIQRLEQGRRWIEARSPLEAEPVSVEDRLGIA